MGCKFCATGTLGIIGDLSAGEILEQLNHANAISTIRNVVFMGMGEPLNNYKNVKFAVEFMIDTKRYSLPNAPAVLVISISISIVIAIVVVISVAIAIALVLTSPTSPLTPPDSQQIQPQPQARDCEHRGGHQCYAEAYR